VQHRLQLKQGFVFKTLRVFSFFKHHQTILICIRFLWWYQSINQSVNQKKINYLPCIQKLTHTQL